MGQVVYCQNQVSLSIFPEKEKLLTKLLLEVCEGAKVGWGKFVEIKFETSYIQILILGNPPSIISSCGVMDELVQGLSELNWLSKKQNIVCIQKFFPLTLIFFSCNYFTFLPVAIVYVK